MRRRRHGEPGIVGEQRDHAVDVTGGERIRETPGQDALLR
jgi:hypothetical protein